MGRYRTNNTGDSLKCRHALSPNAFASSSERAIVARLARASHD